MARIFLSHSSVDEREAVALTHWLAQNGWEDVFLDVDPRRGLAAGERWQESLRAAADRCEAVVFVVSPAWATSKWCLAEFLLAKSLYKLVFGVLLKDVPIDELPTEMTAEWQLCKLLGDGPKETIKVTHRGSSVEFEWLVEGLQRLKTGLQKAGLSADSFAWPPGEEPQRAPYRGLEPLDARDAAVLFGRDVEILRGLEALRGMRASVDKKLFVILGSSGAGKSSFLRAGLLPRLARDDSHFLTLAPVRPEREPLFGEHGLAQSLHRAHGSLRLPRINLGDVKAILRGGSTVALAGFLSQLQQAARARLLATPEPALLPTIILPVDQAEELFNTDAGEEAHAFLRLIGSFLRAEDGAGVIAGRSPPMVVAFTIRSDRYEPLRAASELAGLQSVVFDDLKPMSPTRFREVILGPAKRASEAGGRLVVAPDLVDRLVEDCIAGGDTLPLLGLTLARLYRDYSTERVLRLKDYEAMGGLASIVKTEAESVLSTDPAVRTQQLEQLHAAFIPWLATINPENDQPMRRLARRSDLPAGSLPLIDALAKKRLLRMDMKFDGEEVVEVAHEALLRQWDALAEDWLLNERSDLQEADVLERAAHTWEKNDRKDDWLMGGERLANAETLASKPRFSKRLVACQHFLRASRRSEEVLREEAARRARADLEAAQRLASEQRIRGDVEAQARRDAEASSARLMAGRRKLLWSFSLVGVIAVVAVGMYVQATRSERRALQSERQTKASYERTIASRLAAEALAIFTNARDEGEERALQQLLAGDRVAPGAVDGDLLFAFVRTRQLLKLVETGAPVNAIAFSPDGLRIVSGGDDRVLRQWDVRTGLPIGAPLAGHEGSVSSVAFIPDGSRIVSASADTTLRQWDARTGQPFGNALLGHSGGVTGIAVSPDGQRIVSSSRDGTVQLWDAMTGERLQSARAAAGSVAYSPDGRSIAVSDGVILPATTAWSLDISPKRIESGDSVAFSPIGDQLVSNCQHTKLCRWNARTGRSIGQPLSGHTDSVTTLAFSKDGRRIISGSYDHTLRLWNAEAGNALGEYVGHKSSVSSVAFSPDGRRVASGSRDMSLRVWDSAPEQEHSLSLEEPGGRVYAVAFSPDSSRLVSGSSSGLRVWDATTGRPLGGLFGGNDDELVRSVALSADGRLIVSGSSDTLRLWDAKTREPIGAPLKGHVDDVRSVAFSHDGKRIVSGSDDKTVRLWNASTGAPVGKPLEGHTEAVWSVAFSPDGSLIVSGSEDKTLRLWNANTGQAIGGPFTGHQGGIWSVAFSPDGSRIVSASEDRTMRLWDVKTGQRVGALLEAHKNTVSSAAFSLDGSRVVSGSDDGTLRLWDGNAGHLLGVPLTGHRKWVYAVAISPDGRRIASGSRDHKLRLWPGPTAWPDELCAKLTRNMSRRQWREWVAPEIEYKCQCPGLPIPPDNDGPPGTAESCPGKPAVSMLP